MPHLAARFGGALLAATLIGGALHAAPAAAAPTTDRYVVRVSSDAAAAEVLSSLRRAKAVVNRSYRTVFDGFAVELTAAQARLLRADVVVLDVWPDTTLRTSATQTDPTWGLDRIGQRALPLNGGYRYDTTGAGVTVYVLDTGVRFDHTEFDGPGGTNRAVSGYDFVTDDRDASDCDGHGTHVAGTIAGARYGVAKAARIVSLRVLDCEGSGYLSDFIAALDWAAQDKDGPAVVNISAGGPDNGALDAAVNATVDRQNMAVAVAAGNESLSACNVSPGGAARALTVAATTNTDRRAVFSNVGGCVDLFAPGASVRSADRRSTTGSVVFSGTSMAAPHVAGAVARYLQVNPTASAAQVNSAIVANSTKNVVTNTLGSPNRLLFTPVR